MRIPPHEVAPGFADIGFLAFTTTRQAGSYNLASEEPSANVFARWMHLVDSLSPYADRVATALQVHGDRIIEHSDQWSGWLRETTGADGHLTAAPRTAMAVTLADCVPIFVAHPSGVGAVLHSGWKGTAARILTRGLEQFAAKGLATRETLVHLGPAICGKCYEVGPEVQLAVTGERSTGPSFLDLRAVLADQARQAGARVTISESCTRCHNAKFFSHRAGDSGRQLGVMVLPLASGL